jgi:hypothetical protein
MTTLADISLKVVQQVTDVLDGAATAGAVTSLTDTVNLVQDNQYWDKGSLWIRSGAHSGKVIAVTGYAGSKLTFASLGATPIAAGDLYSVMRFSYPWHQVVSAIRQALENTHVTGENTSLVGDGTTLNFSLPVDVYDIKRVELERPSAAGYQPPSHHWREAGGKLRFDYGYAPVDDDIIHIFYRDQHAALTTYASAISDEIDQEWLKYKAAAILLMWGAGQYGKNPDYLIEERMNMALNSLKGKMARRDGPDIELKTAGG